MCPIGREVMLDPVSCANGHSYERSHIKRWFEHNITSPLTGVVLPNKIVVSNHALCNLIQEGPALCEVVEVDENNPPSLAMQQQNELNGNGTTFSTMQQQASAFPMQSMQSSQEGANAQQPTNNPPAQERSDEFTDQLRQFPSDAEDRDFGLEIPE